MREKNLTPLKMFVYIKIRLNNFKDSVEIPTRDDWERISSWYSQRELSCPVQCVTDT